MPPHFNHIRGAPALIPGNRNLLGISSNRVCALKTKVLRHVLRINHAVFSRLSERCSTCQVIAIQSRAQERTVAICLQPNGNSPLSSGRRAHRLIDRVDDIAHGTVVDAAAGTEAPTWLASVVTDDPAELTVLPTVDVMGAMGLVPPEGGEPAAPPPPPPPAGAPPDDAAGEPGAPVRSRARISVTCPPRAACTVSTGVLPAPRPPFVPATDEGLADPFVARGRGP